MSQGDAGRWCYLQQTCLRGRFTRRKRFRRKSAGCLWRNFDIDLDRLHVLDKFRTSKPKCKENPWRTFTCMQRHNIKLNDFNVPGRVRKLMVGLNVARKVHWIHRILGARPTPTIKSICSKWNEESLSICGAEYNLNVPETLLQWVRCVTTEEEDSPECKEIGWNWLTFNRWHSATT